MIVKKTFEQILEFNHYANWLKQNGEETKLSYAVGKVQKKLFDFIEDYTDEVKDLDIDHASTNEKGVLIMEKEAYSYTPDKMKRLREAKKKHLKEWKTKEFEFENYICTEVPELSDEVKDVLKDFVL